MSHDFDAPTLRESPRPEPRRAPPCPRAAALAALDLALGQGVRSNLHVTGDAFDWLEVDIGRHRHNIEFTQTQSGSGRRRWFSCPDCRRACGIVYFFHGRLSCRLCLGLRYASQLEEPQSRTLRRADRIYGRVGGSFPHDFDPDFPPKPKWMRWTKYHDLEQQHAELRRRAWGQAAAAMGIV